MGEKQADRGELILTAIYDDVNHWLNPNGEECWHCGVTIRVPAELVTTLATGPTGDLAFIVGKKGEPLSKEGFGNLFRAAVKTAGLVDRSAHGLRKTAATRFAEGGATEADLDALFGWTGRKMASLYTRKAERKRMALHAADRMANNRPAPLYPDAPHLKNTATKS